MKVLGSIDYLNDYTFEALALSDVFVSDLYIWIMPPRSFDDVEGDLIRILCSPKNWEEAKKMEQKHNEIYNSPLMRALREF